MAKTFITGANGFLGRNMLEYLLKNTDEEFHLLVRSEASERSIKDRLKWASPERINFVFGDLTFPSFGLNYKDSKIVSKCDKYWHFAAATSFDERKKDEIIKTNISGSDNILSFAKNNNNLENLFFVSTAYVSGNNNGVILEDGLCENNGFKNSYEESKYHCEQKVRSLDIPYTVLRPSIVIGDSKTGDPQGEMRMIYGYVLGIYGALLKHFGNEKNFLEHYNSGKIANVPLRLRGHPTTKKNFICIDDVVGMIGDIMNSDCIQKTYHLTSNNIVGDDVKYGVENSLKFSGIDYTKGKIEDRNPVERRAIRFVQAFDPYCLNHDPKWDTTNTDSALKTHKKIGMDRELFSYMLEEFVKNEIIKPYMRR
jgi:nucleoside-diphosphate-sugar epimerase